MVSLAPGAETLEVEASWGDYVLSSAPDPVEAGGPAESADTREGEAADGELKTRAAEARERWRSSLPAGPVSHSRDRDCLPERRARGARGPQFKRPPGGALQLVRLVRRTRLKLANGEQDVLVCSFFLVNAVPL